MITFEGVDGCGKSTQLALTAEWLREGGLEVTTTFEPGDTPLGAEIRTLLLSGRHTPVPEAELLLFLADRAQHVASVIAPVLESGAWVLCDRFSDSTLAYQLAARAINREGIGSLLGFAELGVRPDATIWLDLPVDTALARMRERVKSGEKATRIDAEAASFHAAVRDGFAERFHSEPERIRRIDAVGTIEAVQQGIRAALKDAIL